MKKVLYNVLVLLITTIITTIGFTALLVAFNTKDNELYVFIPAMIISWIVLLPVYSYWNRLFNKIFKIGEDVI